MTWMETANGNKAHYVPADSRKKEALCGVKADKYDPDHPAFRQNHCKRCEKIKARAKNGNHDEYEPYQVM